jgi:predicted DNA-binding protein YlxM (UPF0122 family)
MDELSKNERLGDLFAFYGPLLTAGQQAYFEEYYYDDLSLSEIAENHGVSRAAVYDNLKRSSRSLEKDERLLGLKVKNDQLLANLQQLEQLVKSGDLQTAAAKIEKIEQQLN